MSRRQLSRLAALATVIAVACGGGDRLTPRAPLQPAADTLLTVEAVPAAVHTCLRTGSGEVIEVGPWRLRSSERNGVLNLYPAFGVPSPTYRSDNGAFPPHSAQFYVTLRPVGLHATAVLVQAGKNFVNTGTTASCLHAGIAYEYQQVPPTVEEMAPVLEFLRSCSESAGAVGQEETQ